MREPRAEARRGAVDEASTAARGGACAPRDQSRPRIAGCHWKPQSTDASPVQGLIHLNGLEAGSKPSARPSNRRIDFIPGRIRMERVGVLVYRLGHGPLKAERRVRFPCALPILKMPNKIKASVSFFGFKNRQLLTLAANMSAVFGYVCRW